MCVVTMAIAEDVRAKDIVYDLSSRELTLGVKGDDALDVTPPMINAEALWGTVRPDDSHWEIDEIDGVGRCVVLELVKKGSEPWDFLLRSQFKPPDTTITCACSGWISNPDPVPHCLTGLPSTAQRASSWSSRSAARRRAASSAACTASRCRERPRTSELCAPARRASPLAASRSTSWAAASTGSSLASCCRVATSPTATAQVRAFGGGVQSEP